MDYTLYHPDWKDIIRPEILKRDNYKCRECGVRHKSKVYKLSNGLYREVDGILEKWCEANNRKVFTLYLQIAHLDHNKANNDPSNLMALCPAHHARFDKEHKRFSRLLYKQKISETKNKNHENKKLLLSESAKELRQFIQEIGGNKFTIEDCVQILEKSFQLFENLPK